MMTKTYSAREARGTEEGKTGRFIPVHVEIAGLPDVGDTLRVAGQLVTIIGRSRVERISQEQAEDHDIVPGGARDFRACFTATCWYRPANDAEIAERQKEIDAHQAAKDAVESAKKQHRADRDAAEAKIAELTAGLVMTSYGPAQRVRPLPRGWEIHHHIFCTAVDPTMAPDVEFLSSEAALVTVADDYVDSFGHRRNLGQLWKTRNGYVRLGNSNDQFFVPDQATADHYRRQWGRLNGVTPERAAEDHANVSEQQQAMYAAVATDDPANYRFRIVTDKPLFSIPGPRTEASFPNRADAEKFLAKMTRSKNDGLRIEEHI